MRWSFNINGQNVPNWNQLLQWGKEVRPAWTLVMDNGTKARQWKNEVGGEVTNRIWDARDGEYHLLVKAIDAAEQMARECDGLQDMWQYYRLNEPGGEWSHLQDWIIDFAKAAKARGFKSTAHGLAIMKNWAQPEWVEAGNVDKLIRYAYENQDTFILNVHEYITGFAWSGHTPQYPANLFNHSLSVEGEKSASINWDTYRPAFVNWFLGRIAWVTNIRAKKIVGDVIPFVVDELIFDWHAAVHQQFVTLADGRRVEMGSELRAVYGDDRYNRDIRGVLGSRRLLEWLITGNANSVPDDNRFADAIMRNFAWAEKNYPENCKAFQLFTMNANWRFPQGHDYIPIAPILLPKMKALATTVPTPVPVPIPTPIETVAKRVRASDTSVRIRKDKSTASPILGYLPQVYIDVRYSTQTWENDGYVWRYLELTIDGTLIKGYVADKFIEIEPSVPIPPEIVLTEVERSLIASYREHDYASLIALLNTPQIMILTDSELELLEFVDERNVRALLSFVIALLPE